jgi:hypothetical protein
MFRSTIPIPPDQFARFLRQIMPRYDFISSDSLFNPGNIEGKIFNQEFKISFILIFILKE